jgi:hypothetical protein
MHCVNSSIFFSTFLRTPSITPANKTRLLEWKVRLDLAMYASRRSPALLLSEVKNYRPAQPEKSSWKDVIERVTGMEDDGHVSKLVRALAHGEKACGAWEGGKGFLLEGDMWRTVANMVVDSVAVGGPTWVRSCGFEEAWEEVPEREGARL